MAWPQSSKLDLQSDFIVDTKLYYLHLCLSSCFENFKKITQEFSWILNRKENKVAATIFFEVTITD